MRTVYTGWWDRHVLPRVVEVTCGAGQIHKQRALACAGLRGRVLEVGFGSGLNVGHYPAAVTEVSVVEPNDTAWRIARDRISGAAVPVLRSGLDGHRLGAADGSCDSVLATFVLCTLPDPRTALVEAHRVLKPGGTVHFLEHGRSPDPPVRRWQRRLEPVQRRLGGGCHLTRSPVELLEEAGFVVELDHAGYLPGPAVGRPFGYLYRGVARKAR